MTKRRLVKFVQNISQFFVVRSPRSESSSSLAYCRLKEKMADWANSDATIFDEIYIPDSRRRRIIDAIELRASDDRLTVRSMASFLAESLRQDVLRGSLGISLRRLEEINAQLSALP